MGRLGDREEDGAGEFYGEKDRKKRAGKKHWKRRTGKNGSEKTNWKRRPGRTVREKCSVGRNAQSGEILSREECSGKTIQKKHGGRKFCAQPKAGSTVVEGGTSEKIL